MPVFMAIIVYFLLISGNYVLFIKKKRSRLLVLLSLVFLLIIMGRNTLCADFEDYQLFYEEQSYPLLIEPGYKWIANFFYSLGFNFIDFRTLYFIIAFSVAAIAIKRLISNYHLLLFVYLTYMVVLDAVQIRNTMAISFLLLGITYLAKSRRLLYAACVSIASLFHFSFFLFMALLAYGRINSLMLKHERIIICVFILLSIISVSGSLLSPVSNFVSTYWGESKDSYLIPQGINLFYLIFPLLYYAIAKMSRELLCLKAPNVNGGEYADIILTIGVLFIVLMPFLAMSKDLLRIIRDTNMELVILITMVFLSNSYSVLNKPNGEGILCVKYKVLLLGFYSLWMFAGQYHPGYLELFRNNLFLN